MRTSFIVLLFALLFVGAIFAAEGAKQATGAKAAADATKPVDVKAGGAKVEVEAAKPVDTKPVDKPVHTNPVETKPVVPESKPPAAETPKKPETKTEQAKPVEPKEEPKVVATPKKEEVKAEAAPKKEEVKTEAAPKKEEAAKPQEVPKETKTEQAKPVEHKEEPKAAPKVEEVKEEPAHPAKTETKPAAEPVKTEAKPAEAKKTEKPAETKKTAEKPKETKPKEKKSTQTESSTGGSAVEDFQKVAFEYLAKAQVLAEKYLAEARVYYVKYGKIAHDNAEKIVDKYLSAQNAKLLKTNFFNFYGVLAIILIFFILAFFSSRIDWVFSLNPVRAFLSAFGLGVFFTLYGFTRLVKDPAPLVSKSSPEAIDNLQIVALGWFATLLALNFVSVLRGGFRNLLQFLTSSLLFVEYFELKHHIEAHTGTLPPYSLILLAFIILSYLSFAQIEATANPAVVYNVDYKLKSTSSSPSHEAPATKEKEKKAKSKKN